MSRVIGVFSIVCAFAGLALAGVEQTGARLGQVLPGPFRAYVVTTAETQSPAEGLQSEERQNFGDPNRVGKFNDFVTRYGLDPTVAVFAREVPAADQPLGKLLQALDQAVAKNRAARLHAFGVFLTLKGDFFADENWAAQIKQIEGLASQAKLRNVPLAFDKAESERTKAYGIGADDKVTILVYVNQMVQARFDFSAAKPLDEPAVQSILADVNKLTAAGR